MHADGEMTPSVAACIDAAARFLAAQPGAVQRTLGTHQWTASSTNGSTPPLQPPFPGSATR